MVTAKIDSHTITRNVSIFKEISGRQNDTSADEDESNDNDVQMTRGQWSVYFVQEFSHCMHFTQ